ncbi:SDR family oxidoreductase [Arthrobacter sp. ISL-30]|uniref:SDR family oxidoreductase n=1 Tax=Arthrobacter sp. ISL-30 TaxID=2819109 RepID=UPI0027E09FE6|nr:SDR family oxidoreductase [Arthrobacter sp. ISL-30]
MSSHQAQRPVRGALPYATAKAAIEGLTRAAAVDHGPHGIRVNALTLGGTCGCSLRQVGVRG